jgi:hypothetical protein
VKKTVWIGLSLIALFLCSLAALAAPPQSMPEVASLDQLRQQIFSPASASPQTAEPAPIAGTPKPLLLGTDPCEQFDGKPCLHWICTCGMVTCAGCGVQTVVCPNPGPESCICNPPC